MSEIDYSVTWTKTTIAATVEWRIAEGGNDVWHVTFTDKESMMAFIEQPQVKVIGVKCRMDPYHVPQLTEEDEYGEAPVGRDTRFTGTPIYEGPWE